MDQILFLQYVLSLLILSGVVFALALLKKRLLRLSARLSEKSQRL